MSSDAVTRLAFGLVAAPGAKVASAFEELAGWMRTHGGVDLEPHLAATYQELAMSVREGTSDVAWLPPVVHAWLAEAVTPLGSIARAGKTTYSAALVVRNDAKIHSLEELAGARAAWVDPWSAAGYVVPRLELARAGIDPTSLFARETFHGTHRAALLAVSAGEADVAATYARRSPDDEEQIEGGWSEMSDVDVRVLGVLGSIPPDVLAARRNLAPASYERALAALRRVCADAAGRVLVHAVFGGHELHEGIEPGHEALRRAYERATANGLFD